MRATAVMALRPGATRRVCAATRAPWRSRPMARRRRLAGRAVLVTAGCALAATVAMALLVTLSNRVVNLRRQGETLQGEQEYQEARVASLQSAWVAASARDVVLQAARDQLGLEPPEVPGTVIVMTDGALPPEVGAQRRLVDGLGEQIAAAAAEERRP